MINIKNISKSFSGRKIFDGFSFRINPKDKVLIKGPSGIGKSTLLNIIMGFEYVDSGEIFFKDTAYSDIDINLIRSFLAWLPQNLNIIGRSKVNDYLNKLKKLSGNLNLNFTKNDILNYFSMLSLQADTLEKDLSNLSGGELQRLGLVICKLLDREIILLDEPTSALDADSTEKAINFILEMNKTIICISHNSDLDKYFNKQIILT